MNITTTTPPMQNVGQATVDQLGAWITLNMDKTGRVLSGTMVNGFLIICYRTKTGFFVRAKINQYGETVAKSHFRDWNEIDGEPCNLIFPEKTPKEDAEFND